MSIRKSYHIILLSGILSTALFSCANRAVGPQGGPKDITPPQLLKASPNNKQLNAKSTEIELEFNEYISLNKASEKIIVSPPQKMAPSIKSSGRKVLVSFNDSLTPNTTYSIDFTNSIIDNTEQNALSDFTYSFSTGESIDTLQIAGTVLNAENLSPLANMQVGIYANLNDTAFLKERPLRIARTDENGKFSIKSVKEGSYHIFALKDGNGDLMFTTNEQLAFLSELIVPSASTVQEKDTTKKDSVAHYINKIVYLPKDLVLLAFNEENTKQSFIKAERKEAYKLTFYFNAPNSKLPTINPLNFTANKKDFIQANEKADTISYWVNDSSIWQQDTLKLSISYEKLDSTNKLYTQIDTIQLGYKKALEINKKKNRKEKATTQDFLAVKHNINTQLDIYSPISFSFDLPILTADTSKLHLFYKVDSTWIETPIDLKQKDSLGFQYEISYEWNPELKYKLDLDSATFISKYGSCSNQTSTSFSIKSLDKYATLIVSLLNYDANAIIQLLDKNEAVIRTETAQEQGTEFETLNPGDYYIRLFIDSNKDKKWNTGNYSEQKQAEQVYYLNKEIKLRANWDVEEEWDYKMNPLPEQKPANLKAKAKVKK